MTDTHVLTGLPSSIRDLTLDLTTLAQSVCLSASVLEARPDLDFPDAEQAILSWETLTGLSGDAALDAARQITRHPLPVTAAVCPF